MTKSRIIDKYELISELGRGGFATVYRARDINMGREVALKVITGNFAQEAAFIERFRQEALTAARLRHPNIVTVYDFGDTGGTLFLAMMLIEGRTLRDLLREAKRLSLDEALPILVQIADALDYLGDQQLVHRDLKPANILLESEAEALHVNLTDFGLVRSLEVSANLTKTTGILGTPTYMAPEQVAPRKWGATTPLSDIYALGVIIYEMLLGRPPFLGDMSAVLHGHAYEEPASPATLVPDLDPALVEVLGRGLAKPLVERYLSAGDFVAALRQIADTRLRQNAQEAELADLIRQANMARDAGDWLAVQGYCVQIMRLNRTNPQALVLMTEATAQMQQESAQEVTRQRYEALYRKGSRALMAGEWKRAIATFAELVDLNPNYEDVGAKLAQAKTEMQHEEWYNEAVGHTEAEHWAGACHAWIRLLRVAPNYRNGNAAAQLLSAIAGLLHQYHRQNKQLAQARGALSLYDSLTILGGSEDWPKVVEVGEKLLEMAPNLSSPQDWLARARVELVAEGPTSPLWSDQKPIIWEKDGKEMVQVPVGKFLYGHQKRKVALAEFWIDKTAVTNAEYQRFIDANPDHPPPYLDQRWAKPYNWDRKRRTFPQDKADYPVVLVDWHDATAYASWAGKRLPTEMEWEKAARGIDGRDYPWGNDAPHPHLCNFGKNREDGPDPVGTYSPQGDSPYGCLDMAGNTWDWTASNYDTQNKVLRGGSWHGNQRSIRAANRVENSPDRRNISVGFRCVVGLGEIVKG